jgi:hypothetical protein
MQVNINTLFGTVSKITVRNTVTVDDPGTQNSMLDFIHREQNIDKDIREADTKLNIKYFPEKYVNEKDTHYKTYVAIKLADVFKKSFDFYMQLGYTQEKSNKLAMAEVLVEKEILEARHKILYPYSVSEAMKKISQHKKF